MNIIILLLLLYHATTAYRWSIETIKEEGEEEKEEEINDFEKKKQWIQIWIFIYPPLSPLYRLERFKKKEEKEEELNDFEK